MRLAVDLLKAALSWIASWFVIDRKKVRVIVMSIGNMEVNSENGKVFKKKKEMDLRSPIPDWISSWKREGIQLKDDDQKKGSMLYLVASWINKGCIIRESKAFTLPQASATQAPTCSQ
jgi:hypothetical protein